VADRAPEREPDPVPADAPETSDPGPGSDPGRTPDSGEPDPEEPPTTPPPDDPEPEEPDPEEPTPPVDPPPVTEPPAGGIGSTVADLLASLGLSGLPGVDLATATLDEIWALLFGTLTQTTGTTGPAAGD